MGNIIMSLKERKQVVVLEKLLDGHISQTEAAKQLRMSARWVREKQRRYAENGAVGITHRSRGKASKRRYPPEKMDEALALLEGEWEGFGPTFAAEKLGVLKGIEISRETLRKEMLKAGIWKQKRKGVKHRKRRERKPMIGEMVQLDGSPHDWFEGRGARCTLLVFIDDATSKVWMRFATSESLMEVMTATKKYVEQFGIPHSFYVDFGSVFSINTNNPERDKKTQWERAMGELGIRVQHAHSPQAKGRVERAHGTMQDRLVKEMRLAGICSIEQANKFLESSNFIDQHNQKFAVAPVAKGDAHQPIIGHDLAHIFCTKETRIVANDFTVTYEKRILQLGAEQPTIVRPKDVVVVQTLLDGTVQLRLRKAKLRFKEIVVRSIGIAKEQKITDFVPRKPSENSRRWAAGLLPKSRHFLRPAESSL
jgi:hypothetical protein